MKRHFTSILLFAALQYYSNPDSSTSIQQSYVPTGNIFIITLDGFRWQEVFRGADFDLISDDRYTPDTATIKALYWSENAEGRRQKLLPFLWNVVGTRGQLYGNREYGNKVNSFNPYSVSYPGYNEIFTGNIDITISSNKKVLNRGINVLEYLNNQEPFRGKVAAFTSWEMFSYILNEKRCGFMLNCGYSGVKDSVANNESEIEVQNNIVGKTDTRCDEMTFVAAFNYLKKNRPRVFYVGLGETDEAAHEKRYDLYLEKAVEADRMIARLWNWVQTTEGYKNNTTFIITTDHGRGSRKHSWSGHGPLIKGSSHTWLCLIGPNIEPLGEMKSKQQVYQKQIAKTIALLVGSDFETSEPAAAPIALLNRIN